MWESTNRLSDEAIASLVSIMHAMERTGHWAASLDMVLIVLLAKPDGGHTPIGLFLTVIRIWMR